MAAYPFGRRMLTGSRLKTAMRGRLTPQDEANERLMTQSQSHSLQKRPRNYLEHHQHSDEHEPNWGQLITSGHTVM